MTRRAAAPVKPELEPRFMDCACNFYGRDDGGRIRPFLVKCPKCRVENYAPCVSSGICGLCGWKAPQQGARKK